MPSPSLSLLLCLDDNLESTVGHLFHIEWHRVFTTLILDARVIHDFGIDAVTVGKSIVAIIDLSTGISSSWREVIR